MPEEKRYYWLKLKRDFFKRHDIKIVEAMPNGKDYVLFYLKLLLESVDHEGQLRFSETIPYDESMLAVITNTNIDVVRSAMKLFMQLNMIEVTDNHTIYMEEAAKMLGFEGWSAERVRKHRKEQELLINALHCNADVTKCNVEIEIDKEKEIEIDKQIELPAKKSPKAPKKAKKPVVEKSAYGSQNNVMLTTEEYDRLVFEFPIAGEAIEYLSNYMVEKNYKTESANLCIRRWVLDAAEKQASKKSNTFQNKQPQYKTQAERIFDL